VVLNSNFRVQVGFFEKIQFLVSCFTGIKIFVQVQNLNATSLTLTGIPSIPLGRIPILPDAGAMKKTFETNCQVEANANVMCHDLWGGHQFQDSAVLLSALLQVELQCPNECLNRFEDRNFSSLNQSTDFETCPNVLGAILAVGLPESTKYYIESYIPSPCLQKMQCSHSWCSVLVDFDLLGISRNIVGSGAQAPVSLLLNLSMQLEVRTVLSTRSTVQYALSNPDTGVIVSGTTAPDMIDGDSSIFFRLFVLNPPIAQASDARVTVVGTSGVIEGIGVRVSYYFFP
jgi:hypothetical protein